MTLTAISGRLGVARRALLVAMTVLALGVAMFAAAVPASAVTFKYGKTTVECNNNSAKTESTWKFEVEGYPAYTRTFTFKGFLCP